MRYGGRLGVAAAAGAGPSLASRADERFALCSTYKFLAAAFVLARVDQGEDDLSRRVHFGSADLVAYSPVTESHAGTDGMMLGDLCKAAVTLSDNTAGNLLLDSFGGPAGLTRFLRSIGDGVTRVDRREPDINENAPGDERDTTTPAAMLRTMQRLLLGDGLSPQSQELAVEWLMACKTGGNRLRAGAPRGWRVGDKTGSGAHNATNDIAVMLPPSGPPILAAAFYTGASGSEPERSAVLAEIGRDAASLAAS
jgi:beta-lactamase class A